MHPFFRFAARLALLLACGLPAAIPAHAGSNAECLVGVARYGDAAIRDFALKVNDQLDARKVNVAIVARAGRLRTQMPRGVSYTHVAFVVFEAVTRDGEVFHTYTVYNLYQQGAGHEDRSYLKQDLTYDFVAGMAEPDIAVCVPVDVLQQRILRVIRSPAYRALYLPDYNLVANPWVERYDNCVTHTLKICVAAIYATDDHARIYDDIRTYFRPTPIRLGPLQALGSNFVPALRRDDMDPAGLQTATFDSLQAFLRTNELVKDAFTLNLDRSPPATAAAK